LKQDHVSGNKFLGRKHPGVSFPHGHRFGRQHVPYRVQRLLRFSLLNKAKQGVDNYDAQNHESIQPLTQQQLANRRREQHIDEDVIDLHEEAHERTPLASRRQPIWAILIQPCRNLVCSQTNVLIGLQFVN
jgi:hypothetical protein